MKITAIKPYPTWVGKRNQLIVKVETDEGIHGWGESGLSGREKAVIGAIEHYREFLVGREGKALGVPVYQLLGVKQREHIPTFATTRGPCGPEMIEQAKELMAGGWNAI